MRVVRFFTILVMLALTCPSLALASSNKPKELYDGPGTYDVSGHWDGGHPYDGVSIDSAGRPSPNYTDGHFSFTPANPDPRVEAIVRDQLLAGGEDAV